MNIVEEENRSRSKLIKIIVRAFCIRTEFMEMNKMSFDEIYNRYFDRIVIYLSRTVGSDEAQDLAQEVFLKVYNSMSSFDNKSSVYTWIYRIATNLLIDKTRKKSLVVDRCNFSDMGLFCKDEKDFMTEELRMVRKEMNECVGTYLKMLPPNYRAIIILREYESMSIEEIAATMNLNHENTKKTLLRARKKLKKILNEQCQFYYNEFNQFSCEKKP